MSRGVSCKSGSKNFENGITNGAAWYPLTGKKINETLLKILNIDICNLCV